MDILNALDQLDREEKAKKPTNTKFINPLHGQQPRTGRSKSRPQSIGRPTSRPTSQSRNRSQPRPQTNSRPPSAGPRNSGLLSPSRGSNPEVYAASERSPSVASTRRISFADPPRPPPTQRRLRIPTKSSSLASGFLFDPKLVKYGVSEVEWRDFSDAVIDAADISRLSSFMWSLQKKDVIKRLKKELQYEGDFKRLLNAWNRNFRKKGFTASLELPGPVRVRDDETPEEREQARKMAKKFRMVITPNQERAGSVYSRSSSLTRSVTGEGVSVQNINKSPSPVTSEKDDEEEEEKKVEEE